LSFHVTAILHVTKSILRLFFGLVLLRRKMKQNLPGPNKTAMPEDTAMFQTTVPRTAGDRPVSVFFARPDVYSTTPGFGRATRACPAYDPKGIASPSSKTVGDDIIASGDVKCSPQQETQTKKYSQCDRRACQKGLAISPHIHCHFVLDLVGTSLTAFASSKELVQAIHDALLGDSS